MPLPGLLYTAGVSTQVHVRLPGTAGGGACRGGAPLIDTSFPRFHGLPPDPFLSRQHGENPGPRPSPPHAHAPLALPWLPYINLGLRNRGSVGLPMQEGLHPSNPRIPVARAPEGEDIGGTGGGQKTRAGAEAEAIPVSHPDCLPEGGALRGSPFSRWPFQYSTEAKIWIQTWVLSLAV